MHLLAHIKRYLASRFLAVPDRAHRSTSNENTARSNAAEASATMRKRREDREDVEECLQARRGVGAP